MFHKEILLNHFNLYYWGLLAKTLDILNQSETKTLLLNSQEFPMMETCNFKEKSSNKDFFFHFPYEIKRDTFCLLTVNNAKFT